MAASSRSTLTVILLVATAGLVVAAEHTQDSLETVKKMVADKSAIILDVREKDEWTDGHLKGARFVALSELKKGVETEKLVKRLRLDELKQEESQSGKEKETVIYVHCASGNRCLPAARILKKLGFDARPLKPGYEQLLDAGFAKDEDREKKEL
ncbi:MAG: rhodanese-like domain-containing protein [Planctomycetaceae bacterium]